MIKIQYRLRNYFILFSFLLINIRKLFNVDSLWWDLSNWIVFGIFWISIFFNVTYFNGISLPRKYVNHKIGILFLVYLIILIIGFIRASMNGVIGVSGLFSTLFRLFTLSVFIFTTYVVALRNGALHKVFETFISSLNLYLFIVIILFFFGLENANSHMFVSNQNASILAVTGIYKKRVHFPMAPGINSFGLLAGVSFISNFINLKYNLTNKKLFAFLSILAALFIILLVDSKGALLYSLLTIILIEIVPTKIYRLFSYLPVLSPAYPWILLRIISVIPYGIADLFIRASGLELTTRRVVFWNYILSKLQQFSLIQLFGFGFWGQLQIGFFEYFYIYFANDVSTDEMLSTNVHSFTLQIILDYGYIGAVIFIIIFVNLIKQCAINFNKSKQVIYLAFMGVILYFIFMGTTEAVPTPIFQETFFLFLGIFMALLFHPQSEYYNAKKVC